MNNQEEDNSYNFVINNIYLPLARQNLLRRLYRTGQTVNELENERINSLILQTLLERPHIKKIITEEAKTKIRKEKFNKEIHKEINHKCPIWQIEFEEGQEICILPCNHGFSTDAIEQWLEKEKAECPVCRYEFESKELIEKQNSQSNTNDTLQISENSQPNEDVNAEPSLMENDVNSQLHLSILELENQLLSSLLTRYTSENSNPSFPTTIQSIQSRVNLSSPVDLLIPSQRNLLQSFLSTYQMNNYNTFNAIIGHNHLQSPGNYSYQNFIHSIPMQENESISTHEENDPDLTEAIRRSLIEK